VFLREYLKMAGLKKETQELISSMQSKIVASLASTPTQLLATISEIERIDPESFDNGQEKIKETKEEVLNHLGQLLELAEEREKQLDLIKELQDQAATGGTPPVLNVENADDAKTRNRKEKQRIAEYKKMIKEAMKDTIKVKFQNLEDDTMDVPFSFEGYHFHLKPGEVKALPKIVVDHLNKITYPKYSAVVDDATGQTKMARYEGNRFACVPVD
jgi:hypothetical protein